jgi:hypothetical protein
MVLRRQDIGSKRGWHKDDTGTHFYHHPKHQGLIAMHEGRHWSWMHRHNGRWWWYHPGRRRWVGYDDNRWWMLDKDIFRWEEQEDKFCRIRKTANWAGDVECEPSEPGDPSSPGGGEEQYEKTYVSPDLKRQVLVVGPRRMAHLYKVVPEEHIAYLGEGVKTVRFHYDQYNNDALVIVLEFKDGRLGLFDQDGNLYGPAPKKEDAAGGAARALEGVPDGVAVPAALPPAPPEAQGIPVQGR